MKMQRIEDMTNKLKTQVGFQSITAAVFVGVLLWPSLATLLGPLSGTHNVGNMVVFWVYWRKQGCKTGVGLKRKTAIVKSSDCFGCGFAVMSTCVVL